MSTTTPTAPDLVHFLDSTADDAGRIILAAAANLASEPAAPAELLSRAIKAAAGLLAPRACRGDALTFAEATAAELASQAPRAWHRAQAAA